MPRELSNQHRVGVQAVLSAFSQRMAQMQTRNNMPPAPTVLAADQARQGVTVHNVRYVLGFGLAGVIISLMVVGFLATHGWLGTV